MWKTQILAPAIALLLSAAPLLAQDKVDLNDLVSKAKAGFQPVSDAQLTSAKTELVSALATLDSHLNSLGGDARTQWRTELLLDALDTALQGESTNINALRASLAKLKQNKKGMEADAFLAARGALERYERALLIQGNPQSKALYEQQVTALGAKIKEYEAKPTVASSLQIGSTIGNLELASQAKSLIAGVRSRFRRPNIRAGISKRLASAGMSEPIDRTENVNELILGTSTSGVARMIGNTSINFHPSDDRAELEVLLSGTAHSNNVGVNRGVTIRSLGNTNLQAGARVAITPEGVLVDPAWANASTGTTITGIYHKSCLVRKIAQRRVAESKGQAEQIASQRAANRIAGRLNHESSQTIGELNENFLTKFRYPLLRKGEFPSLFNLSTSSDALSVIMTQANAYQLAAGSEAPARKEGMDLGVQLHESFVGNMSQGMIGGETLNSDKLAETLKEMTGKVPEGLAAEDEPEWSITFSRVLPIQVTFGDNLINLKIRGRKFTRGDTVVNSEMEIAASYKVERTPKGVKLTRQGEVTAQYTKKGFQRPDMIAIKTVMRKKFTALLKESRDFDGLELPGRWKSAGKLSLQQMNCGKQWLVLGWTMPKPVAQNSEGQPQVAAQDVTPQDSTGE